jgi:hypothetical protein
MDPITGLTIAGTCIGLVASITRTLVQITTFVRRVRTARQDLDSVSREFFSLKNLPEILAEDVSTDGSSYGGVVKAFPKSLEGHIVHVVGNCNTVVGQLGLLLDQYSDKTFTNGTRWELTGRDEAERLRFSLEAHKQTLDIALEMITICVVVETKSDTTAIRQDTDILKQDTTKILEEIGRLQAIIIQRGDRDLVAGPNFALKRYLDDLESYAESVGELPRSEELWSNGGDSPSKNSKVERVISADDRASLSKDRSENNIIIWCRIRSKSVKNSQARAKSPKPLVIYPRFRLITTDNAKIRQVHRGIR